MSTIKDRAAIVGIGQTAFSKSLEPDETELACQAVLAALEDAGIEPAEVDGLCSYGQETTDEAELAAALGTGDLTFFSQVGFGGGGGCATVAHAAMAISCSAADVVVAWRSRKRGSARPWASAGGPQLPIPAEWTRPAGLLRPSDEVAVLTRRHMFEHGTRREHLANVALAARAHANRNPLAVMFDRELTLDTYLASRWISEPLCLFDNCLESDGAVAVVVVSAERARDCRQVPAYVHAAAQGLPRQHQAMVNYFADEPIRTPSTVAGHALWRHADVTPADVDVAQIYDAFTPMVLFGLEGYGFCPIGESGPFTEDGGLSFDGGRLPTNTAGGSLSEAYLHGFNLITEGVRQVRGTSHSQVEGAEISFVSSGDCVPTSALVLRR